MARTPSTIELTSEERSYLESKARARTVQAQVACRARILILKADGEKVDDIADKVGLNRKSVMLCISKFKEGGVENALSDAPGRGRNAEITDDERAWIVNLACQRPRDLGYAAETWTYALLTKHVHDSAEEAGFRRLSTVHKSTVHKILDEAEVKPFRIRYYCENRDPDFDSKMHNVLLVYKQLSMQFDEEGNLLPFDDGPVVHVLSCDEKPGIQAIATTSPDLPPDAAHGFVARDYEYRRLGTLSLMAGIDLQTTFDATRCGFAGGPLYDNKVPKLIKRDYEPGARVAVHRKDILNAKHYAHHLGVDTPMTDVVLHVMDWMNDTGRIDEDQIAMVKYYEDKMDVRAGSEA